MEKQEVVTVGENPLLIVYKLATLLHDPAWKPWVVSAAFGGVGRVLAKKPGSGDPAAAKTCKRLVREINIDGDAHMLDAAAAALNILEPLNEEFAAVVAGLILDKRSVVAEADRLAAALDRWVLTYREKKLKDVKVKAGGARYANPLEPRFSYSLKDSINVEHVCNFVKKLRNTVEKLREAPLPLLYNVLLFALEPLWYEECRGCVPLADTRTPTHTVFDHVYATASMTNWLYGGEPEGFMVKLDVAGIQEFISSARKTRDLWAGSWLVSALAWYTVSEAVMLLGADIVLSPYPLANHFFIATLLRELKDEATRRGLNAGEGFVDVLAELDKLARQAFLWSGAANQPIVPGTFFLALPCIDEEEKQRLLAQAARMHTVDADSASLLLDALASCDEEKLRKYFVERFREAWQNVARAVMETYKAKASSRREAVESLGELLERAGVLDGWSPGDADRYIEETVAEPPLRLRVVVANVAEAYQRLLSEVKDALKKPSHELADALKKAGVRTQDAKELARKLLLHYMFSKALPSVEERSLEGSLTVEPGYRVANTLEELTHRAFEEADKKPPGFHECSVCGRLPSIVYIGSEGCDALWRRAGIPRSMFTEGERLCPYCLIRRLMTLDEALENVMDALVLYKAERVRVYPRVPSTSELSAMSQYLALIDTMLNEPKLLERLYDSLAKELGGSMENAEGYVAAPLRAYVNSKADNRDAANKLLRVLGALETYDLSHLVASGALRDERTCIDAKLPAEACSALVEAARKAGLTARRYYVVVRGDGDLFGSCIVRGSLDYGSPEEYVEKLLERGIVDPSARKTLDKYYKSYAKLLTLLIMHVAGLSEEPTVVVTPSYYIALSRGQMLTALYDAAIVAALGGFPVYAGGDDVAALVPGNLCPQKLRGLVDAWLKMNRKKMGDLAATPLGRLVDHVKGLGTGSVAAAAVVLTRRNYWGLLGVAPGFHVTPIGAVYAAPAAYGRSYGVYVAHYRDPFQAVWRTAGDLEELKDTITVCRARASTDSSGCIEKCSRKDMVFLSYGRASGIVARNIDVFAALPNLVPCATKDDAAKPRDSPVARPLENAAKLLELMSTRKVSRSLIYDFERELALAATLAERIRGCDGWAAGAVDKLAEMLAGRNSGQDAAELVKELARYCGDAYVKVESKAGAPLSWQLVRSVKVLQSAGR